MISKLVKDLIKTLAFLRYRFQYLFNYIIIGFLSILIEALIVRYPLTFLEVPYFLKIFSGFLIGMLFAFILNSKLNFKVPKSKNKRSFFLFLIISVIAFVLNLSLIYFLKDRIPLSYIQLRFFTAGAIFILSYTAHRNLTFNFVKKVGVAIYLNKNGELSDIYSKIRYYSDFIHIDLVDKTFDENSSNIDLSIMKEIDKTWGLKKIIHIMSKKPSIWIQKLNKNADIFIFHLNIDEPILKIISLIKSHNKKAGICICSSSDMDSILEYLPYVDFVQIMGIDELGKSGTSFNPESLERVKKLNQLKKNYNFEIIFDGGVKPTNIHLINAKYIVSSSGILSSINPVTAFLDLKTSSRYRNIEKELRDEILKNVKKIAESLDFIVSANIVGSFSENEGIKGVNDIDTIIITDNLNKKKFNLILNKFENLKKELESKYGFKIIINPTLGPLKFNLNSIVFHLMIYDIKSHKEHCFKSPFTCLDWQRSKIFFKKSMLKIYSVRFLQPSYFFNSRRSAKEYLEEIKSNRISYRKYEFKGNNVFEDKNYKVMDSRDKIEFSFHIIRFLIHNFLKLYYNQNLNCSLNKITKLYFEIFPKNKKNHKIFLNHLRTSKEKMVFDEIHNLDKKTERFILDFEEQFKDYFYNNSKEIIFIRHAKTNLNKEDYFIGQKSNPSISAPDKKIINNLKDELKEVDLIFSSPLKRCKETLKLISEKNPIEDTRLTEINYGDVDGKDFDYLSKNYPEVIESWEFGEDSRFPNGENNLDVYQRMSSFIQTLKKINNKKILVCTHNVFLRCLIGSYLKIPLKKWYKLTIPHLEPIKFLLTKDNRIYIELTDNQIKEIFKNLD